MLLLIKKIKAAAVIICGCYFTDDAKANAYYFDDAKTKRYTTSD